MNDTNSERIEAAYRVLSQCEYPDVVAVAEIVRDRALRGNLVALVALEEAASLLTERRIT